MKLINFDDIMKKAEARHQTENSDERGIVSFAPDDSTIALVSAAVDEMNTRLAALSGWDR